MLTLIWRTAGWAIICAIRTGALFVDNEIKFRTPAGKPASSNSSTTSAWDLGVSSDVLRTIVLPHKIGAAMALMVRAIGAFHGAIARLYIYDRRTWQLTLD